MPVTLFVPFISQPCWRWASRYHWGNHCHFYIKANTAQSPACYLWTPTIRSQEHSVIWISKSKLGPPSADSLYPGPQAVCSKMREESLFSVMKLHDLLQQPPTHPAPKNQVSISGVLGAVLSPPHTEAKVGHKAKAITGVVTSMLVLQGETTHRACARVWAVTALSTCTCSCFHGWHHNYTTIAQSQSLFERPHAWHASAAVLNGSVQFTSVLCIPSCLAGALQVLCPGTGTSKDKEVACSEDHWVWLSRETLWQPLLGASANP